MSKITVIGAGVMGSTVAFPACDNGHEVSVVGTPYDREIIARLKKDKYHYYKVIFLYIIIKRRRKIC